MKAGGVLSEKYPGGLERQKELLEREGHSITAKGKKYVVDDYERRLARF